MNLAAWFDTGHGVDVVIALLHFLWQGSLIAALVAAANLLVPARAAAVRYAYTAVAFLAMGLCLPVNYLLVLDRDAGIVTLTAEQPLEGNRPLTKAAPQSAEASSGNGSIAGSPPPVALPETLASRSPLTISGAAADPSLGPTWLEWSAPGVLVVYACGVIVMLLRLTIALGGGYRLHRDAVAVRDHAILDLLARKGQDLGLRVLPAIAYSGRIAGPLIVGVLRPVILLPPSILTELTPCQLEAVLVHELAHLRRWDHLANVVQRVIESLLFFHPAAWYVSGCLSRERENCCDDRVLAGGTEVASYAELLVRISELSQVHNGPSVTTLAAAGMKNSRLRSRIVRMLAADAHTPVRLSPIGISAVFAAVLLLGVASVFLRVHAATEDRSLQRQGPATAFEEVVVKPHEEQDTAHNTRAADAHGDRPATGILRGDAARTGNFAATEVSRVANVFPVVKANAQHATGLVVAGSTAYFSGENANAQSSLWAADLATGQTLWQVAAPGDIKTPAAPVVAGEHVYFGGADRQVYCLRRDSGTVIWKAAVPRVPNSTPIVIGDRLLLCTDHVVVGLDRHTGERKWESPACFPGPIAAVGNTVYIVSCRGLIAVDAASGAIHWRNKGISGPAETLQDIAVADGRIYVATLRGTGNRERPRRSDVVAFSATNGAYQWRSKGEPEEIPSTTPGAALDRGLAVAGNVIVQTTTGGKVVGIATADGERLWQLALDGPAATAPSIAGTIAYVGMHSGNVLAINVRRGKLLWKRGFQGGVRSNPLPVERSLLVLNTSGTLFRVNAEATWGMPNEGIQALLTARRTRWLAGQTPELVGQVRNRGTDTWWIPVAQYRCEIVLDGTTYHWRGSPHRSPRSASYRPGESFENTPISLSADWKDKRTGKALTLQPGKHEVRVVYLPFQHDAAGMINKTIRVVSQPVTIQIAEQADQEADQEVGQRAAPLEFRIVPNAIGSSRKPVLPVFDNNSEQSAVDKLRKELAEQGPNPGRRRNDAFQWYRLDGKPTPPMLTGKYRNETYVLLCGEPAYAMRWDGRWALERVAKAHAGGRPAIEFRLNPAGAERLRSITKANQGNHLAVVVNGRVVTTPVIRSRISRQGMITGVFTDRQIDQMIQALSAGVTKPGGEQPTGKD